MRVRVAVGRLALAMVGVLGAVGIGSLSPVTGGPVAGAAAPGTTTVEATMANQVIGYVNAERTARGLPALAESSMLDDVAQSVADSLPDGTGDHPIAPYEPAGWGGGAIVEEDSPTSSFLSGGAVIEWLASPYYVDQVIGGLATDPMGQIGVGVACANGGEYIELATAWKTATSGAQPTTPASGLNDWSGSSCSQPIAGYDEVARDGGIFSFGGAGFYGSMGGTHLNQPIVGMTRTPDGGGYWQVASDGGIFAFGDAGFYGSMGDRPLNRPIVGMAATPDGRGYWLVASDGGIFAFGDAPFYGSMGGTHLNQPIVGMAATSDGGGYWLVAKDGGIFAFGDAPFLGSAVGLTSSPVVGMATSPGSGRYWIAEQNGTVIAPAPIGGEIAPSNRNDIVGIASLPYGDGYWLVASGGGVFVGGNYGVYYHGSMAGQPLNQPIVGVG